jgi:hypothetical protein|tara:strand:+ start:599 stop:868 length:270 start_codon:yes stop_codon:yes gene_type:complete
MALVKREEDDKIEIVGKFRNVQIRTVVIVEEDGKEISRSYKRKVLMSDDDISNESAEVKEICNTVWTTAVKKKYADWKVAEEAKYSREP